MKTVEKDYDVESFGVMGTSVFTLKATAQTFRILSSNLYSDNILAIIRELSCNARDAHEVAGKPEEPFQIHLPTGLEPWFAVIDNGTGLSDEQISGYLDTETNEWVSGIYTTYFDSSKNNDNRLTGMLGLGSKVGFSFAQTFDVISRYNGTKRFYTAFLDEAGLPSISKMNEIPTDECNGLEVRIGVVSKQHQEMFRSKLQAGVMFLPVTPTIIGAPFQFEDQSQRLAHKGQNFRMVNARFSKEPSIIGVYGHVGYPIKDQHLSDKFKIADLMKRIGMQLIIDIPPGTVEVAASREEFYYGEETVAQLTRSLNEAANDLAVDIYKHFEPFEKLSDWEFYHKCLDKIKREVYGANGLGLLSNLRDTTTRIETLGFLFSATSEPRYERFCRFLSDRGKMKIDLTNLGRCVISIYENIGRQRLSSVPKRSARHLNKCEVTPDEVRGIFVNDLSSGAVSRSVARARQFGASTCVIVEILELGANGEEKNSKRITDDQISGLSKAFRGSGVIKASEINYAGTGRSTVNTGVYALIKTRSRDVSWKMIEDIGYLESDDDTKVAFINIYNAKYIKAADKQVFEKNTEELFDTLSRMLVTAGVTAGRQYLVGVNPKGKKIAESKGWVDAIQFATDLVASNSNPNLVEAVNNRLEQSRYRFNRSSANFIYAMAADANKPIYEAVQTLRDESPFKQMFNSVYQIANDKTMLLASKAMNIITPVNTDDVLKNENKKVEDYALLQFIDLGTGAGSTKYLEALKYVRTVDDEMFTPATGVL